MNAQTNNEGPEQDCAVVEHLRIYWETMLLSQEFERNLQTLEVLVEAISRGTIAGSAAEAEIAFKNRKTKTISASCEKLRKHLDLKKNTIRWQKAQEERNWLAHESLLEYADYGKRLNAVSRIASARQAIEAANREVLDVAADLIEATGGSAPQNVTRRGSS